MGNFKKVVLWSVYKNLNENHYHHNYHYYVDRKEKNNTYISSIGILFLGFIFTALTLGGYNKNTSFIKDKMILEKNTTYEYKLDKHKEFMFLPNNDVIIKMNNNDETPICDNFLDYFVITKKPLKLFLIIGI